MRCLPKIPFSVGFFIALIFCFTSIGDCATPYRAYEKNNLIPILPINNNSGAYKVNEDVPFEVLVQSPLFSADPSPTLLKKFPGASFQNSEKIESRYKLWPRKRGEFVPKKMSPNSEKGGNERVQFTINRPGMYFVTQVLDRHINFPLEKGQGMGGTGETIVTGNGIFTLEVEDHTPPIFPRIHLAQNEREKNVISLMEEPENGPLPKNFRFNYKGFGFDAFGKREKSGTKVVLIGKETLIQAEDAPLFLNSGSTIKILAEMRDNSERRLKVNEWSFIELQEGRIEKRVSEPNPKEVTLPGPNFPSLKYKNSHPTYFQFLATDLAGNSTKLRIRVNIKNSK